jgi:hypothetical protein
MKLTSKAIPLFLVLLLAFSSGCTSTTFVLVPKHAPPGQVKKATGSKSAKAYAPGQQKKKH